MAPHLLVDCLETKAFPIADENRFEAPVQVVFGRPVGCHVVHAAMVEFALEAIVILALDCKKATNTAHLELVRHNRHRRRRRRRGSSC